MHLAVITYEIWRALLARTSLISVILGNRDVLSKKEIIL